MVRRASLTMRSVYSCFLSVDPRAAVIYGRTKTSEGISRRWHALEVHRLIHDMQNALSGWDAPILAPSRWREPREDVDAYSEVSGSSRGEPNVPYVLGRWERAERLLWLRSRLLHRAR